MEGIDGSRRSYIRAVGLAVGSGAIAGCTDAGIDDDTGEVGGEDGDSGTERDGGDDSGGPETDDGDGSDDEGTEDHDGEDGTERDDGDDVEEGEDTAPADVTIPSSVGAVDGTLYGAGDCGVVLTPQVNLDRESWEPQASRWADGYLVLAIDPIEGETSASVVGAIDSLREERGVESVVLVGASIGGEASVVAGAERDGIVSGVAALSPGGGEEHAEDLTGEKLFVVAADDDRFVEATETLSERAPEPKELVVYEGDAHGQRLFDSEHASDLLDRLDAFVAAACD